MAKTKLNFEKLFVSGKKVLKTFFASNRNGLSQKYDDITFIYVEKELISIKPIKIKPPKIKIKNAILFFLSSN